MHQKRGLSVPDWRPLTTAGVTFCRDGKYVNTRAGRSRCHDGACSRVHELPGIRHHGRCTVLCTLHRDKGAVTIANRWMLGSLIDRLS